MSYLDKRRGLLRLWALDAQKAERKDAHLALIAALNATADPATVAMVTLHERREGYGLIRCEGCDQGCSCDSAAWPCSTIVALAKLRGIDTTGVLR